MAVIKKYINFRVTNEEHRAFQALVDRLKKPLGTWAREVLLREMGLNPKLKDLLGAEVTGSPIEIPEPVTAPPAPEGPEPLPSNKSLTEYLQESPLPATIESPVPSPKPIPAIERMYQIILKRDGKEAADNWRRLREPVQSVTIPDHMQAFYDRIVESQGKPAADFWLVQNRTQLKR